MLEQQRALPKLLSHNWKSPAGQNVPVSCSINNTSLDLRLNPNPEKWPQNDIPSPSDFPVDSVRFCSLYSPLPKPIFINQDYQIVKRDLSFQLTCLHC